MTSQCLACDNWQRATSMATNYTMQKKKGMRSHAANQESLSAATKTTSKHSYIHVGEHATEQHPQA